MKNLFDPYIIFLSICLLIFIIFRGQYLPIAFHWDEMWSYVPAVRTMNATGISLLPSSMNPEVSRGHPLFFYFLNASFIKIFGTSNTALHTLPLIISCICVYSVYTLGKELYSKKVGLISCCLLLVQSLFIMQSAMVLPEVMVATLTLIAFYSFIKNQAFLYFLIGSLLVLTKESGIILPISLATCYFFQVFSLRSKFFWKNLFWLLSPLATFTLFLIIQKFTFGWFFFPEHIGMMKKSFSSIIDSISNVITYTFLAQNRRFLFVLGSAIVGILFITKRSKHKSTQKYDPYFLSFIFFYILFCSINFFTIRYALVTIPIAIIWLVGSIFYLIDENKHIFPIVFFIGTGTLALHYSLTTKKDSDDNLGAIGLINVQQNAIDYLQTVASKQDTINIKNAFIKKHALSNPYCGYIIIPFTYFEEAFTPGHIGYFLSIEPDEDYQKLKSEGKIEVIKKFQENNSVAEIYRVK